MAIIKKKLKTRLKFLSFLITRPKAKTKSIFSIKLIFLRKERLKFLEKNKFINKLTHMSISSQKYVFFNHSKFFL